MRVRTTDWARPGSVSSVRRDAAAAAKDGVKKNSKASRKSDEGASGGQGKERATDPDVDEEGPPPPPDKGLFTGNNRKQLDRVAALDNLPAMNLYTGLKGPKKPGDAGMGKGTGYGVTSAHRIAEIDPQGGLARTVPVF